MATTDVQPEQKRLKFDEVFVFNDGLLESIQSQKFLRKYLHLVDKGSWDYTGKGVPNLKQRKCRKDSRCCKFDHGPMFGTTVCDVYSVFVIPNDQRKSDEITECFGKLYGSVEPVDYEKPGYSFFYVKKDDAVTIDLNGGKKVRLPLSGPSFPPPTLIAHSFLVRFALVFNGDKDLFSEGDPYHDNDLFGEDEVRSLMACLHLHSGRILNRACDNISRLLISDLEDPILFVADLAVFGHGVWACVEEFKIFKDGVKSFSGYITARPCVFYYQVPLLSIKSGEQVEVESGTMIKLQRSILAVPSYATLIIEAELYDQLGNLIVSDAAFFSALSGGRESKVIIGSGTGKIEVAVKWVCYCPVVTPSNLPTPLQFALMDY